MSKKVPIRYWLVISGLLALAFALTAVASVRWWASPWQPVVAFVTLGVAPMAFWAFLGAFVFDPTRTRNGIVDENAPSLRDRMRLALVPLMFAAAVFTAAALVWTAPSVRVSTVGAASEGRMVDAVAEALKDPAPQVRVAACEALRESGADSAGLQLAERLFDPSEEVVDCALEALSPGYLNPVTLAMVESAWARELMTEEEMEPDRACRVAARVRAGDRLGLERATTDLLSCSLSAPSEPARECCAQAFRSVLGPAEATPSMILPPPAQMIRAGFLPHVARLIYASTGDDENVERRREQLRLNPESQATWAFALGCEGLTVGGATWRDEISTAMALGASNEQCQLLPATERTVRLWTAVCSTMFADGAVETATPAEFCQAVTDAVAVDAVNEAQRETHQALRAARAPGARRAVIESLLDYGARTAASSVPQSSTVSRSPVRMLAPGEILEVIMKSNPDRDLVQSFKEHDNGSGDVFETLNQVMKARRSGHQNSGSARSIQGSSP